MKKRKMALMVKELHGSLNSITALYVSLHGYEHDIDRALDILEKSSEQYGLPIRATLAEEIDRRKKKE